MGLNSLLLYIISMRYYVDNLIINNIKYISEYQTKYSKGNILLGHDGLYKYINDELYKFKVRGNNENIIKLDSFNIISTDTSWKKYDISYKIPFIFKNLIQETYDFNIEKDITLRIEKINDNISDYYFISKYDLDDFFLKEGIISFLSVFNNINNI